MDSDIGLEEAVVITRDMIVEIPAKGSEIKNNKITFEKNMSPFPLFILAVILLNISLFAFEISTGALLGGDALLQAGALKRELVLQGEYWRLISSSFLHGDSTHLYSNLIFLYILGMAAEHAFGLKRMILIYFTAILSGSLLSMTMNSAISVGASDAIFGLMGALIVYFRKNRQLFNLRDGNIGIFIAIIAVIQIFFGFTDAHIDNYAHIGGLLGGVMIALLLKNKLSTKEEQLPRISGLRKIAILFSLAVISFIWLLGQGYINMVIAELSFSNKYFNNAISYSSSALKFNPRNTYAYIVRGKAYAALNQNDKAEQDMERYVAANHNQIEGYIILAKFFSSQDNYAAAIKNYSEAIAIKPSVGLYNSRGYMKILLGEYEDSRSDFQEVIKIDNKYAPGYGNLGLLDAIAGSYDSAIKLIDKSYELDHSLKVVKELSAALQAEQHGDYSSAVKNYESFSKKTKNEKGWQAEYQFAVKQMNMLNAKNNPSHFPSAQLI
ncbi:MAG: rhomboid family intramembrane serine protease [Pelosinus sp.]|nr:rhomboid family intramembrane serine protease [Pelosinus sp.]